ncbi:MAG: SURF1 family protein [Alphaproteobacteria bacterium]
MSATSNRLRLTVAAVAAIAVLVGLGSWQLVRLGWKTDLIQRAEARLGAPAAALPGDLADPEVDFLRVTVDGTVAAPGVLFRPGGSASGRAGLRAMAAFDVGRSDGAVLVDLGWLPIDARGAAIPLPDGPVRIVGALRLPEPPGWLTGANDPNGNLWQSFDWPAMAAALGVPALVPALLRAETVSTPDGAPWVADGLERGPVAIDLRNDHLQYALTWFALAVALAVIYLLLMRRSRKGPMHR